jgi:large subunit ribosomal protein L10
MIEAAPSFIITRYKKLNPNVSSAIRKQLAAQGASMEVVRKRLLQKALEKVGVQRPRQELPGHISVVFMGGDPVATTKVLFQFIQENEDVITVLKGKLDGAVVSAEDVNMLSKLPGELEMRAQLIGVLQAPLTQTLGVMEALLSGVPSCLLQKSEKGS